ncbi:MAG TPA: protein kinase [Gemmatimonadaceae bacterium]|nr:protein kinase [Gemmatimonadaceae bacterium]
MATLVPDQLQNALGTEYVLEREIGRGGMATVYVARDTKHGRMVALKVLNGGLTMSVGAERFRREITVAAALRHPHILTVLDSGATPAGQLWFTMPYVEGETLRYRIARDGALPISDAVRIARQTADALEYAHDCGVIHRDIKPENILLGGGHAQVADFGIARLLADDDGETTGAALTSSGMAIGTLGYMSPEQASGVRALDRRTDVYSLGVVVYEMLAGESPFRGVMADALFAAMVSSEPPSVRAVRPEVPEDLDAALRKALAAAPADRWGSAGEFAAALASAEWTIVGTPTPPIPIAPSPPGVPTRRALIGAVVCAGLVIGTGVLVTWSGGRAAPPNDGTRSGSLRLAVLPFENTGDSSDAYFADGVTDAVRGKLAGLSALEVIGSASSAQYRHSIKTPQEIGRELGVPYLLEGKVRWAKGLDGTSRVRVTSELVDVGTGADKWAEPFDAPLTDVFQVQSDIAGEVAQQLEVALTPATAHALAGQPTTDLTAYDDYLRGEALVAAGGGLAMIQRHIALFTEAVGRDSTFALAWAGLARAQTGEYIDGVPSPALADSIDRNSARAVALAPDVADAHTARATYYVKIRRDPVRALSEDSIVLALAPRDANALQRAANVEAILGRWDAATSHAAAAVRLDPQSVLAGGELGYLLELQHHYPQARAALEHAAVLAPTKLGIIQERLFLALLEGDLAGARALLRSVSPSVDRNTLVAYVATYVDLGWVLDSSDAERVLTLGPAGFGGDRGDWAFVLAQQYAFRGDRRRTRIYADTARLEFEAELKATSADPQRLALLGVALAYLDRPEAAIRAGERAVALLPFTRDAFLAPYVRYQLVRIYTLLGQPERALDTLEPLLRVPYTVSPGWLRIDPNVAPLRGNPRFDRLTVDSAPRM